MGATRPTQLKIMPLSQEDNFRLQVLLKQQLKAVRIDESSMVLYALTDKGEAKLELHANCRDEPYLRQIKELLSTHVLGSPGGYPVYLKRWTRMGQTRTESLQSLLLLGEPEAVVAVAHAQGIDEEIARRAWWAMPTSDVARRMLENAQVANSEFGKALAAFLMEFLPFEEDPNAMIESVRLVLQPGLISDKERLSLWRKAGRKTAMYVGFLLAGAANLPNEDAALAVNETLRELSQNAEIPPTLVPILAQLSELPGQAFMDTVCSVLKKMANQDVALQLFRAIQLYFNPMQQITQQLPRDIESVRSQAESSLNLLSQQQATINDNTSTTIRAVYHLAHVSDHLLNPIFAQTDAVGSVMRKRMQFLSDFIIENIYVLQGKL